MYQLIIWACKLWLTSLKIANWSLIHSVFVSIELEVEITQIFILYISSYCMLRTISKNLLWILQDSNEIHFRVEISTQMGKLKKSYSERVGVPVASSRFLFDGRRINDEETRVKRMEEYGWGGGVWMVGGCIVLRSKIKERAKRKGSGGRGGVALIIFWGQGCCECGRGMPYYCEWGGAWGWGMGVWHGCMHGRWQCK